MGPLEIDVDPSSRKKEGENGDAAKATRLREAFPSFSHSEGIMISNQVKRKMAQRLYLDSLSPPGPI